MCRAPRLLLLAALAVAAGTASAASTEKECLKKGFANPSCTVCDTATDFVRDTAFLADCRACCVADAAADAPRAAAAVLEVCSSRLRAFPHTESFIKSHAKAYGGKVTVRQRFGWPPRLLLLGEDGRPLDAPVAIDNWKTEAIVEFLAGRGLEKK